MKMAVMLGVLCLFGVAGYAMVDQHAAQVRQRPLLPLNFDHRIHGSVNCLTCHHDYAQKTQTPGDAPTCILCHKATPVLATRIEDDFHQLCRGCHLQRSQTLQAGGPVRSCQQCHVLPLPALEKALH